MSFSFTNIKDKKIMIYEKKTIKDSAGFSSTKYVPIFDRKIWTTYRFMGGNRDLINMATHTTEVCSFTVNWSDKIAAGMNVFYNGQLYNITRVDNFEGYKKDIKLYCEINLKWNKDEILSN